MPKSDLIKARCPFCDKTVGIRADQKAKRLKCPACKRNFSYDAAEPQLSLRQDAAGVWEQVEDAEEVVVATPRPQPRNWPKAKITASFQRSQEILFKAATHAIRECRCDIVSVDRVNFHVRFAFSVEGADRTLHDLYVFDAIGEKTELDISSREPNVDEAFTAPYHAILKEIGKFVMFAEAPAKPAALPYAPPPMPRRRFKRKRASTGAGDGMALAGFICGIVGLVFFCIPLIGGGLGMLAVLFGIIGLNSDGRSKGFAVASLCLGLIAVGLALYLFLIVRAAQAHNGF